MKTEIIEHHLINILSQLHSIKEEAYQIEIITAIHLIILI